MKQLSRWLPAGLLAAVGLLAFVPARADDDPDRAAIALEALSRLKGIDLEANPGVKAAVLKMLEKARGTPQFVAMVRDFRIKDQEPALLEFAGTNTQAAVGGEALKLVLQGSKPELLQAALGSSNAMRLVAALGYTGDHAIVPLLSPLVMDQARDVALRTQAVRALAQVQPGAVALVQLAEERRLPEEVRLGAATALNSVPWEELKHRAAQVLPMPPGREATPLPAISELVKQPGDPANGAKIFRGETVACYKCHQVNGEGTDFGPALSEIGTKLGKDALYEAILNPSAGISFGFEAWQINLKNGDDATGLIVSETTDELALKTVGGNVTRYQKSAIASRTQQKLSIMPAGLQQALTRQELIDLVEYLASLKKATH